MSEESPQSPSLGSGFKVQGYLGQVQVEAASCPEVRRSDTSHITVLVLTDPPSSHLSPASFSSSLSCFRPPMLPPTRTVSMVFRHPETAVPLSMVTRCVPQTASYLASRAEGRGRSCALGSVASAGRSSAGLASR